MAMGRALSIAAVLIVVGGIIAILSGRVVAGIVLIVLACIVGPGGMSISKR